MNIICNSCVGARIYELLNMQFNNPFTWNMIEYNTFKYIIIYYNSLDLQNFVITHENTKKHTIVKYNNNINIIYPHYRYDSTIKQIIKNGPDVIGTDIDIYIKDTLTRRINRFKLNNDKPIFIFDTSYNCDVNYTLDNIYDFIQLQTPYIKILITNLLNENEANNINTNTIIITYQHNKKIPTYKKAEIIINKLQHIIK